MAVRPVDRPFAWQGWHLSIPRRWDPAQLAGDARAGHALFADAVRPRLGLRWHTPRQGRRFDPETAVRRALTAEVGTLAAAEAVPHGLAAGDWSSPWLYVEPAPPGRDVWVGFSETSGRVLTVVAHVRRRDRVLAPRLLPTVADAPLDRAAPWAAFDLSLTVPADFALIERRLDAGDLSLSFADRRRAAVAVRQVAVAELALRRRPLDGWLLDAQRPWSRTHRSAGPAVDATTAVGPGRLAWVRRRRRFALAWWHPPVVATLAVHDVGRDRLVILTGTDDGLLRIVAETVGGPVEFYHPPEPDTEQCPPAGVPASHDFA